MRRDVLITDAWLKIVRCTCCICCYWSCNLCPPFLLGWIDLNYNVTSLNLSRKGGKRRKKNAELEMKALVVGYDRGTGNGARLVLLAFHFSTLGTYIYW